jgi:hypothetical protein
MCVLLPLFNGFSTVVYDPPFAANDSFLTTSFSTSVLQDFSNLAIGATNANLQVIVTETPPAADFNNAVSNTTFNLQNIVTETTPVADFNAAVSNTALIYKNTWMIFLSLRHLHLYHQLISLGI